VACVLAVGCASSPSGLEAKRRGEPTISLEKAQQLMLGGEVAEIFQPHVGCVILTLRDGRLETFEQPHLDWVLAFVREKKLEHIPVSME
jgi:hypothetical protein